MLTGYRLPRPSDNGAGFQAGKPYSA